LRPIWRDADADANRNSDGNADGNGNSHGKRDGNINTDRNPKNYPHAEISSKCYVAANSSSSPDAISYSNFATAYSGAPAIGLMTWQHWSAKL
jgi:hypothetical protein